MGFYQQELQVGADGSDDRLMFIWPTTIVHKIDKHSPLYALSAQDMLKERFEIVVMLGKCAINKLGKIPKSLIIVSSILTS